MLRLWTVPRVGDFKSSCAASLRLSTSKRSSVQPAEDPARIWRRRSTIGWDWTFLEISPRG